MFPTTMGILMHVEVISREIIRPSSPTPLNLRTFKITLLDQLSPHMIYTPIIFFYPPSSDNKVTEILTWLKNSVSKTLTEFYQLAGRIKDHSSIDCNDEGVLFFEAKVSYQLCEFFKQPEIYLLYKFLPCPIFSLEPTNTLVQVAIQLNVFSCGGIAIGLCFLHKIIDGATMSAFVKRWAANASWHYNKEEQYPYCNGAWDIIPCIDSQANMSLDFEQFCKKGKGIVQRFVFDPASLSNLKAKAASPVVPNLTRVEVVSAFIWKHAMAASKAVLGSQKSSILTPAVNLRHRMVPPLSENTVGNIFWPAVARHNSNDVDPGEDQIELHYLVALLRQAVIEVNDNYSRRIKGNEGCLEIFKFFQQVKEMCLIEKVEHYPFSSWCRMGFTEVDFGWGKPAWVSCIGYKWEDMFMNFVVLVDSILNDGIEAWVLLGEHEMAKLESDPEFLEFALLNPSIQIK